MRLRQFCAVIEMRLLLDPEWEEKLKGARIIIRCVRDRWYATANGEYIHRLVIGAKKGEKVDHLNDNGLDNRRRNLRIATLGQNRQRTLKKAIAQSQFLGVHVRQNRPTKWQAKIWHDNKCYYLGGFQSETDAAKAYDNAALRFLGNMRD